MSPNDPRHGSEAGHEQHARDLEEPCDNCRQAKLLATRRRTKRKSMGYIYTTPSDAARETLTRWREAGASIGEIADHIGIVESRVFDISSGTNPRIYARTALKIIEADPWPVTSLGVTRRIRALARNGWGVSRVAAMAGINHDTVLDARREVRQFVSKRTRLGVVAAYDELAGRVADGPQRAVSRVRNEAERNGWPSPWAWDNIDDPNERPDLASLDRDIDPVVVSRILAHDATLARTANVAERRAVVAAWPGSLADLERMTGWRADRYVDRKDGAA